MTNKIDEIIAMGKRLKMLRVMAGLERGELSAQAGVSNASITYWEHGTSPMREKSIQKIILALNRAGVKCDELWLKTGKTTETSLQNTFLHESPLHAHQKFSGEFAIENEIKQFMLHYPCAIIKKIEYGFLSPLLEISDIIGVVWEKIPASLIKETIAVIETPYGEEIRLIKNGTKPFLYDLYYLTVDIHTDTPHYLKNVFLKAWAPLYRLWRKQL